MFAKYKKSSDCTKILLMYLLLNGYGVKNVEWVEESEENRQYGLKIKKIYGITKDFVDIKRIEQDMEKIQIPLICSPLSYEYYSDAPQVFTFERAIPDVPLWINDMNVISKVMIITEDKVVSSNPAFPLVDDRCCSKGFMYFHSYVINNDCTIGKWHMTYSDSDSSFSIFYLSTNKNITEELLMYRADGIDKMSSYKLVIYVISRASLGIDQWIPDNFEQQCYEKAGTT